jgi:hypothetical protein
VVANNPDTEYHHSQRIAATMSGTEDAGKEMSVIFCRESDLLSEEGTLGRWNMPCRATILLALSATAIRDI